MTFSERAVPTAGGLAPRPPARVSFHHMNIIITLGSEYCVQLFSFVFFLNQMIHLLFPHLDDSYVLSKIRRIKLSNYCRIDLVINFYIVS